MMPQLPAETSRALTPRIVVGAAAFALFWQLMLPPVVAVPNNGDYYKLLSHFALGTDNVFQFANTRYTFDAKYWPGNDAGFYSSELVLIVAALGVNEVLSKDGSFDLRIIGALQAAILLLTLWLFVPLLDVSPRPIAAAIGAATVFLFCDFLYAGYCNSFYMDVPALLFTLMGAVFYMRAVRWRRRADAIGLLVCALMVVAAKPQYAPLSLWFAALFWMARRVLWNGRRSIAVAACAMALGAGALTYRLFAPRGYSVSALYNVIFYQILPHTKNSSALADLGLDDAYRRWIGTHSFSPGTPLSDPKFAAPFAARVSYASIARYYLKHPADAYRAVRTSLDEAGRFEIPMGNFDYRSGEPPLAENRSFTLASRLKRAIFFHHGSRLLFMFIGLAALVLALTVRNRARLPEGAVGGAAALCGIAVTSLLISALADVFDPTRHQLVFFACFDLLLVAALWLAWFTCAGLRLPWRHEAQYRPLVFRRRAVRAGRG